MEILVGCVTQNRQSACHGSCAIQLVSNAPLFYVCLLVFGSLAESDPKLGILDGPKANEHVACRMYFGVSFEMMLCSTIVSV